MSSEWSPGSKPVKLFPSTPHGDAVVIPVNAFLTRVAPPLRHTFDVAQIVRNLLRTNKRWPVIQNGRWRVFTQDPADSDQPRTRRYKRLENVMEAIHKAAGVTEVPVLLIQRSQCVMDSEDRDQHTLPDAYFSRGRCARDWSDVAAFGELHEKDSDADFEENVRKVTESMHHCMKKDARRRFVYAFTINNATIRLWFCDRSQILVTEPFNYITDHHALVHFFLSMMYASPSDLGLDSTMTLSEDGRHYDIKLCSSDHTRTYRTLKLLSPLEFYLLSKATRVWKAVRVEEGKEVGPPVVLKDMWRFPHLESEGIILKNLLDDLNKDSGRANSSFVAIEEYGDVYLDEECTILDCTSVFNPADAIRPSPLTCRADLLDRGSRGRLARVHHRIMIKEVCKPLNTETSLAKVFQHLSQITQTLRTLHLAGWVHRDISPANILLKNDETALLADLEYAKPMGTAPEQRTGTPGFIALEVVIGKYRFPPRKDSLPPSGEHTLMEKVRETKDGKSVFKDAPKAVPTYHSVDGEGLPDVRYNPLHDLESVWWIAVHSIATQEIYNADGAGSEPSVASPAQRQYAAELFDDMAGVARQGALFDPGTFMSDMVNIAGLPEVPTRVALALDSLREVLVAQYITAEHDVGTIGRTSAGSLYDNFCEVFKSLATDLKLQKCMLRPFTLSPEEEHALPSYEQRQRKRKRAGTDDTECEDDRGRGRPRPRQYLPRAAKAPRRHA